MENQTAPRIKRFIECLLPVTFCNLRCDYCYVIQENRRAMKMPNFKYSIAEMKAALTRERFGGTCYFSICGAGETLAPKEILPIVRGLLENGHFVNLTNNGTISQRIDEFCKFPQELRSRLHFAFSFHYLELKKRNLLETFFRNVKKVRDAGCSFLVQINLYDGYVPVWDEIGEICMREIGAFPQVALTRDEANKQMKIFSSKTTEEYIEIGQKFNSPLFDFTVKNFNVKRKEFCYAGAWSGKLYLETGILSGCYGQGIQQDIFADPQKPIKFCAIGNNCKSPYCVNSSHFLSLGVIPGLKTPSYAELRNRPEANWYQPQMAEFLNSRLYQSNKEYSFFKKWLCNLRWRKANSKLNSQKNNKKMKGKSKKNPWYRKIFDALVPASRAKIQHSERHILEEISRQNAQLREEIKKLQEKIDKK